MKSSTRSGFVLPVVLCSMLVVGILAGSALSLILNATRSAGAYTSATYCRLSAQSALDREKAETLRAFRAYFRTSPSTWNLLAWFDTTSETSVGLSGYENPLCQNDSINGCSVSVTLLAVTRTPVTAVNQFARLTLRAVASSTTPAGIPVTRVIEETVEYGLRRASVFDYAYFVNNYGWFMGGGVTANGDIRANGDLFLDGASWVNGNAYAAANSELGSSGAISGTAQYKTVTEYWALGNLRARPTTPTSSDGLLWAMGYDGTCHLNDYNEPLDMPFLGDLDAYREIAHTWGSTIKQNGKVLVDACHSGSGPSGLTGGADKGCLVLDGSVRPIEIDGPIVVDGDVIIKGTVTGQGAIYAGRNIHIVGNITNGDPPSWPKPDTKPEQTVKKNEKKDMLGLAAKGNIVLGDYTASGWMNSVRDYITPPFVKPYACDPSDASIGYSGTFGGNYTLRDSGTKVEYAYNSKKKIWEPSSTSDRRYYESTVGNRRIAELAQSGDITRIDAVLYNNHATMGRVGQCQFNGALVCRDEGIIYNRSVQFNWDIRLGSTSPDGINFFIFLPMSPATPRVIEWQEVKP